MTSTSHPRIVTSTTSPRCRTRRTSAQPERDRLAAHRGLGPDRSLPTAASGRRSGVLVVGLSGGRLPPGSRPSDRPRARLGRRCRTLEWSAVDRNARKGTSPSDHAPVIVDLSELSVTSDECAALSRGIEQPARRQSRRGRSTRRVRAADPGRCSAISPSTRSVQTASGRMPAAREPRPLATRGAARASPSGATGS